MNLTEQEIIIMNTKPRYLSDENKKERIRIYQREYKRKLSIQEVKDYSNFNLKEEEINLLKQKPINLTDEEKQIRKKYNKKIEYQTNKDYYKDYRDSNKKKDEELIRVIIAKIN